MAPGNCVHGQGAAGHSATLTVNVSAPPQNTLAGVYVAAERSNQIVGLATTLAVPPPPPAHGSLFLWPGLDPQPGGQNFLPIDNVAARIVRAGPERLVRFRRCDFDAGRQRHDVSDRDDDALFTCATDDADAAAADVRAAITSAVTPFLRA